MHTTIRRPLPVISFRNYSYTTLVKSFTMYHARWTPPSSENTRSTRLPNSEWRRARFIAGRDGQRFPSVFRSYKRRYVAFRPQPASQLRPFTAGSSFNTVSGQIWSGFAFRPNSESTKLRLFHCFTLLHLEINNNVDSINIFFFMKLDCNKCKL